MLTGTYSRTIDEKQRIAIPKPIREAMGDLDSLYVAPGNEGCLSVFPPDRFQQQAARLSEQSQGSPSVRAYQRLFFSRSEMVVLDRQRRLRIPERLAVQAGIERDVVIVGVQDHVEIWAESRWQAFVESHADDFDELTQAAYQWQTPARPSLPSR